MSASMTMMIIIVAPMTRSITISLSHLLLEEVGLEDVGRVRALILLVGWASPLGVGIKSCHLLQVLENSSVNLIGCFLNNKQ